MCSLWPLIWWGRRNLPKPIFQVHQEAQAEYTRRYGGGPGPIVPVHTRNDVENIALCGEEDFRPIFLVAAVSGFRQNGGHVAFQ